VIRFSAALGTLLALASPVAAQQPAAPQGALTLLQAIQLGRQRGVQAMLARINARIAETRVGQRRADILPTIDGTAAYSRQTLNLQEFGLTFPGLPEKTPDFSLWRFRLGAQQTLFDASVFARLRAARDSAVAAGFDAQAVGEIAGATAGLSYLQV